MENNELNEQLLSCVGNGDFEGVLDAMDAGADVNALSGDGGLTPLMLSVACGHRDIAEHLLGMGADANLANARCVLPMHYAALTGNLQLRDLLHRHGAAIDPAAAPEPFSFFDVVGAVRLRDSVSQ